MEKKEFLEQIVEGMHQVVIATLDEVKKPVTNIVTLNIYENTIGFTIEKGTKLYKQILEQGYVSLFGYKENVQIQINGNVLKDDKDIFYIENGEGKYIDTTHNIQEIFTLGKDEIPDGGYYVTDTCILCGTCYAVCPKQCIDTAKDPVVIKQKECVQCGECMQVCPVQAIMRK